MRDSRCVKKIRVGSNGACLELQPFAPRGSILLGSLRLCVRVLCAVLSVPPRPRELTGTEEERERERERERELLARFGRLMFQPTD